ncbi:pilus assembly protein [Massilia sp. TW-1]|uniref:Pilus assembly protein n=1 Tax=Telluria antibiotica TaxID=2717319 RepID=A0ABX0PCU7_9BURK|nr:TadE family protein [Telluria antibiotica]NIA55176.1 pilus assembly protein [Telluria antibiotica]
MKHQKGIALVEFALILPMFVMLLFLTTEFGRAYYQYDTITKSVRQAARYLSVRAQGKDIANAKNIIVYGNPTGTGSPLVPGLTLSNVPDPVWNTAGSYPVMNTVTVSVTGFTFVPLAGNVFGMSLNNIVFGTIQATMRSPS